jgi:hypothetical protein
MPNDATAAMAALRRHLLNGAFEAVEIIGFTLAPDFKCLVVIVSALIALRHKIPPIPSFEASNGERTLVAPNIYHAVDMLVLRFTAIMKMTTVG